MISLMSACVKCNWRAMAANKCYHKWEFGNVLGTPLLQILLLPPKGKRLVQLSLKYLLKALNSDLLWRGGDSRTHLKAQSSMQNCFIAICTFRLDKPYSPLLFQQVSNASFLQVLLNMYRNNIPRNFSCQQQVPASPYILPAGTWFTCLPARIPYCTICTKMSKIIRFTAINHKQVLITWDCKEEDLFSPPSLFSVLIGYIFRVILLFEGSENKQKMHCKSGGRKVPERSWNFLDFCLFIDDVMNHTKSQVLQLHLEPWEP